MSDIASNSGFSSCSSVSSPSSSSSEEDGFPLSPISILHDPDFIGIIPYQSLKEHTFIYDININMTMTTNHQKSHLRQDCVGTALLVILVQVFHDHEEWRKIGIYLMEKLEEKSEENGCWTTEKMNHHVYHGKLNISGHCAEFKDLPEDLPVAYEDFNADFSMVTNGKGKGKSNRQVLYQARVFLSPGVHSANNFYADHGFDQHEGDWTWNLERRETRKCLKLHLNIMKNQRKGEGREYDSQQAWKTISDAVKEVREDPNYEVSGDESPGYNERYGRPVIYY